MPVMQSIFTKTNETCAWRPNSRPWIRINLGWFFFFLDKRDQFESNFMQTDFNNSSVFRFKKFARSVKSWKRLFRIGKNVIGRNSIMERIFLREKIWALFFF